MNLNNKQTKTGIIIFLLLLLIGFVFLALLDNKKNNTIKILGKDKKRSEVTIKHIEKERDNLLSKLDSLEKESLLDKQRIENLRKDIEYINLMMERSDGVITNEMLSYISEIQDDLKNAEIENAELINRYKNNQLTDSEKLKLQNDKIREKDELIQQLKDSITVMHKEMETIQSKHNQEIERIEKLYQSNLNNILREKDEDIRSLKNKLAKFDKEKRTYASNTQKLNKEINRLRQTVLDLEGKKTELRNKILLSEEEKQQQRKAYDKELEKALQELKEKEDGLLSLNRNLDDLKDKSLTVEYSIRENKKRAKTFNLDEKLGHTPNKVKKINIGFIVGKDVLNEGKGKVEVKLFKNDTELKPFTQDVLVSGLGATAQLDVMYLYNKKLEKGFYEVKIFHEGKEIKGLSKKFRIS